MSDTQALIERLTIKSGVMKMGEPIAWGSDTALMDKAAVELARLEQEIERLRAALIEAREDIVHWAGYVSDYFKDKHDYVGDLARIDAALEAKP